MLLDAGQTLSQIIDKADVGSLHAIREWAPTYLDAKTKGAQTALGPMERSINQRWTQLVSDPEPVTEYMEAAGAVAQFEHMAESLSGRIDGRNPGFGSLEDAFAARYAGQAATANLGTLEAASHTQGGAA